MALVTSSQIVDAAYDACDGVVGATVEKWRTLPVQTGDLPRVVCYVSDVKEDPISLSDPSTLNRTDTLSIDTHVRATDGSWITDLDAIQSKVKRALFNDADFLEIGDIEGVTSKVEFDISGEARRAVGVLTIRLSQTATYEPLTSSDIDLEEVHHTLTHDESGTDVEHTQVIGGLDA